VVGTATEEFLSPEEVGERLGVSVYTVRRWIKTGRLRAFRPGKEYRIQESDLEEFLRAREVRPKAPRRSPFEPSLLNGLEEERRTRFADAITVAADRWGEALSSADMQDRERFGLIKAALDLSNAISQRAEKEDWDALPNQERHEIVATMEKLREAVERGLEHLQESAEARTQDDQAKQLREQIREMTRRISA
jgi:excisionase family DNA binding protein